MYFTISTGLTIENDQSKQKGHLGFFFVAVTYTKLMLVFFFPRSNSAKQVVSSTRNSILSQTYLASSKAQRLSLGDCLRAFMTDASKRFDANFKEQGFARLW